ncbi:MAG: histidine kinase [Myxococcota bacterium]
MQLIASEAAPPPAPRIEATPRTTPGVTRLLRDRSFWLVQVVGWVTAIVAYWGSAMVHAVSRGMEPGLAIVSLLVGTLVPIAVSSSLALGAQRLPLPWLTPRRALPLLVLSSLLAAVVCTGAMFVYFTLFVIEGDDGPNVSRFTAMSLPPFAAMMVAWGAVMLFNLMSRRTQQIRERALVAESLATRAQLSALRAQMNPHFLLNSLSSVVTLIRVSPGQAEQMVHDLSSLFVRSLDAMNRETTSLAEELDFVRAYLRCEGLRFEERLKVRVAVPGALEATPIPSMLLQPLVENAIKHGLPNAAHLELEVRAREEDARVVLEVANTGHVVAGEPEAHAGSGLRIVERRLAAACPETGSFALVQEARWVVARVAYDPAELLRTTAEAAEEPAPPGSRGAAQHREEACHAT